MTSSEQRPRILVIDDDPLLIKLAENVLTANGYEVITTQEAAVGLEIALKQRPALIILDVMMPIINGYNICRLIKSEEGCPGIPVILLTSRSEDKDREIGVEVGADAYIAKPFNTDDLLSRVRDFIRPRE